MHFDHALELAGEGQVQRSSICCCSVVMFLGGFLSAAVFFISPQISCEVGSEWKHLLIAYIPFLIGLMLGGYFFGALSDANGRKYSLHVSSMMCFVATFMLASSSIFLLLDISKFLLGFSLAGIKNGCTVLIFELLPPSCRGKRVVLLDVIWNFGSSAAIAISGHFLVGKKLSPVIFQMTAWRLLVVGIGLLFITGSSLLSLIPVSARQMVAHQRLVSATILLRRISALHKEVSEDSCGNVELQQFSNIERQRHRLQHSSGCAYFLCRWLAYTIHIFDLERLFITLVTLLLSGFLFNASLLLNAWMSERILNRHSDCYLHGARPINKTIFYEVCYNEKPFFYEENVYISFASATATILLPLIIDCCFRKIILAFSCMMGAGTLFLQSYLTGYTWSVVVAVITAATHAVATSTLSVIIMENNPTKFRCTALGLNSLSAVAVNTIFSFIWNGKCTYIFIVIAYMFMGAAVISIFLPNLNKTLISE